MAAKAYQRVITVGTYTDADGVEHSISLKVNEEGALAVSGVELGDVAIEAGTKIDAATLEAGGVGILGWLSSVRLYQETVSAAIADVEAAIAAQVVTDNAGLIAAIEAVEAAIVAPVELPSDGSSFTGGESDVRVIGGVYGPSLPPVESGQLAAIAIDANRSLQAVIVDENGAQIGTVTIPFQVTQAALTEGIDQIAGLKKLSLSGQATAENETVILSPASGNYLRIYSLTLQHEDDTAVTVLALQNTGGTQVMRTRLIDDGHPAVQRWDYLEFAVDQDLVLDLSAASDVGWTVVYTDRDPSAYPQES